MASIRKQGSLGSVILQDEYSGTFLFQSSLCLIVHDLIDSPIMHKIYFVTVLRSYVLLTETFSLSPFYSSVKVSNGTRGQASLPGLQTLALGGWELRSIHTRRQVAAKMSPRHISGGAPNGNIVQNHLIALLNAFQYLNGRYRYIFIPQNFLICLNFLAESLMRKRKKAPEN